MLELIDISRVYELGSQPVTALRKIDLKIGDGEFVAIMGQSGSGKSTLMHIIGCLDRPSQGRYIVDGHGVETLSSDELAAIRNKKFGFVFQQFNLLSRMSALENVLLPLIYAREGTFKTREEKKERAKYVLKLVGLQDRMEHRPSQLSGGQQQRVSIARALVNDPSILLADEPTGALDSQTSKETMTLLEELHSRGMTVILVTHDAEVASYAKRLVKIRDGLITSDAPTSRL